MFIFDKIPQSQLRNANGYIPPSIKNTFFLLRSHCNIHTHMCSIYIRELAAESHREKRTICKHLAWLINHGFIDRQLRKKKGNPKENDKSLFTILRWELTDTTSQGEYNTKKSIPTEFLVRQESRDFKREKRPKESNQMGKHKLPISDSSHISSIILRAISLPEEVNDR